MEPLRGDELPSAFDGRVVSRAVQIPTPSRRAVVRWMDRPGIVWVEPHGTATIGTGAAATLIAAGPDRFQRIRDGCETLFEDMQFKGGDSVARPRLFGGFSFLDDQKFEPPWETFPGARFVLPETQVTWTNGSAWLTQTTAGQSGDDTIEERLAGTKEALSTLPSPDSSGSPPGLTSIERTPDRQGWTATVQAALDRIDRGELRKVVLAQALRGQLQTSPDPGALLARLGAANPDCFRFLFGTEDARLVGATPERLVSLSGHTVETGALAGTSARGETATEDERLAKSLAGDQKNTHEHDLVAEAIDERLEPFAAAISKGERRVRRLANVQHLETPISAELEEDEHVLQLVEALHPTPAVGGLPADRAVATIRETEPFDRGWYAGPVGWVDADGDGTFAVAIRSGVLSGRSATLFAGVGIVADSDPDREWTEVQLKYRPLLDALR